MTRLEVLLSIHIKNSIALHHTPENVFASSPRAKRLLIESAPAVSTTTYIADEINGRDMHDLAILDGISHSISDDSISAIVKSVAQNGLFILFTPNNESNRTNLPRVIEACGLSPILKEPVGKRDRLHGDTLVHSHLSRFLFNSEKHSPLLLFIYKKNEVEHTVNYVKQTSMRQKLFRLKNRVNIYIDSRTSLGKPLAIVRHYARFTIHKLRDALGYYDRKYLNSIFPDINQATPYNPNKTRLLIVMTWLEVGGVERVMINIIRGLDKEKFEIHLLTSVESLHPWENEFIKAGAIVHHVASIIDHAWPYRFRSRYIGDYAVVNSVDTVLITNSRPAYESIPYIKERLPELKVFDLLHTHGTPKDDDAFLKIGAPYDSYMTKRIVIDEYLKKYYQQKYHISPSHILIIYNGLTEDHLREGGGLGKTRRAMNTRPVISYMGRLDYDKSPLRLIEIANELKRRDIKATIKIFGHGALETEMRNLIKEYNLGEEFVMLCGNTDNPMKEMSQSDFIILTSDAEGIPMSVLESMACSTPAILPSVGGIPEIVTHKQDGYLCNIASEKTEADKIKCFADAIEAACQLNAKDYLSMRKASREKIKDKFSSMTKDYSRILKKH